MSYIVDIQGFNLLKSKFLCKEIAILNIANGNITHRFINYTTLDEDVFNKKNLQHINFTKKNIHGISWSHQHPDIQTLFQEQIADFLKEQTINITNMIIVKGLEKKTWLLQFIKNPIYDLYDVGCPSLNKLRKMYKSSCSSYHCRKHDENNSLRCACENVKNLYNWYLSKHTPPI